MRKKSRIKIAALLAAGMAASSGLMQVQAQENKISAGEYKARFERILEAEEGDVIVWGSYDQDDDRENGKEPIEWIVMSSYDDMIMVMAKESIASVSYNDTWTCTWENSKIREWMNTELLREAFTEYEQTPLLCVGIAGAIADGKEERDPDTEDTLFLFDTEDAEIYFADNEERKANYTTTAGRSGTAGSWWLRSSGRTGWAVAEDGSVKNGYSMGEHFGVRPVMCIDKQYISENLYDEICEQAESEGDAASLIDETSLVTETDEISGPETGKEQVTAARSDDQIRKLQVGDQVLFGTWEQDDDFFDGAEALEWMVMDIQGEKALLVTKYAIDRALYCEWNGNALYSDSALRTWLNDDFYSYAFAKEEQDMIETTLINGDNQMVFSGAGQDIEAEDKVFILSKAEVKNYFAEGYFAEAKPTPFAAGQFQAGIDDMVYCWARYQYGNGTESITKYQMLDTRNIDKVKRWDIKDRYGVRPAVWINTSNLADDSVVRISQSYHRDDMTREKLNTCAVGDTVSFGRYGFDRYPYEAEQAVQWTVLDRREDRVLLLSKYGFWDEEYYDEDKSGKNANITWKDSDVRAFLQDTLYPLWFTEEEKEQIILSPAMEEVSDRVRECDDTDNTLFLLSIEEVEYYLPDEASRILYTDPRIEVEYNFIRDWFLRSIHAKGDREGEAAFISQAGIVEGTNVQYPKYFRPAVWVQVES